MLKKLLPATTTFLLCTALFSCGGDYKTPEDVKGTVAWLDSRSALPVFPFGTNPIYFYVNSHESPVCQNMHKYVFSRPEIIKYMNKHFTSISVMPDSFSTVVFMGREISSGELMATLQVEGYPSHFFFSSTGELKGVRTGYIGLREFKQLLRYISEGYIEKYSFQTFQTMPEADLDTVRGKF